MKNNDGKFKECRTCFECFDGDIPLDFVENCKVDVDFCPAERGYKIVDLLTDDDEIEDIAIGIDFENLLMDVEDVDDFEEDEEVNN